GEAVDKLVGFPENRASKQSNHRRLERGGLSKATLSWRCDLMIAQVCVLPLQGTLRGVAFWLGNMRPFQLSRHVVLVKHGERSDEKPLRGKNGPGSTLARGIPTA